jgi:hypothetical protein
LREVADEPPTVRVVVLGKQSDVVASRQRPLEQRAGLVGPAGQCESVGQPEGAGKKGASALIDPEDGQHPVDEVLLAVRESLFQHQPVPGVGDFAVDVKLELTGCGIAGPHPRRPVMARKPGRLPFGQVPLPLGL